MIDIKLRRIQSLAVVILILIGLFWLVGCLGGPQKIQLKSCQENAGKEVSCQTFEISGEASILPF